MPGLVPLSNIILDFRKADGTVNAGGTLEFFENLTLTPKTVFNGFGSTTPLANPLQLDAGGFEPGAWLGDGIYRVRMRETAPTFPSVLGPIVWTKDYISPVTLATVVNYTTNTTLDATHNGKIITVSAGAQLSLTAAATLGNGWRAYIKNSDASTSTTLARLDTGNTIDGSAANAIIIPGQMIQVVVNSTTNGFVTDLSTVQLKGNQSVAGNKTYSGTATFDSTVTVNNVLTLIANTTSTNKPLVKDHGLKSANYTLQLDEADEHLVNFSANATLTIASTRTNDRALVIVKTGGFTITLVGIDNNSPTLTAVASKQDFLALAKSFGKITCMSTNLNQPTV